MKSRLKILQNERAVLVAEAEGIFAKARSEENRKLSAEENARDDQIAEEIKALDEEIVREKRHLDRERSAPAGITSDPEPADPATAAANPWKTLTEQLRAAKQAALTGVVDPRLVPSAATGSSEGIASDGGYLVHPEFAAPWIKEAIDAGELTSKTFRLPLQRNTIEIPTVDETSRATGSRWGGVRVYWAAEAEAATKSKPKVANIKLSVSRLVGLSYATDDQLEDGPAYEALLQRAFREEFSFTLDDALIRGTGSGPPLGILNAGCLVTVSKETSQAADTILVENVDNMFARLHARSMRKAFWYINQDCLPQLMGMTKSVGTGGVPVYMGPNGVADAPFGTLRGRPIIPIEQCSTVGDVGDIILADFSQYVLADKGGVRSAVSMHVKFIEEEQTFRWSLRTDGQPLWRTALTPYKGTNTLSPFVALAARA